MAMTNPVELRANYLREAAHLLAVPSPSACAFLGAAKDRLLEDFTATISPKELDASRRETCGACGALMIPGWSCQVSNRPRPQNGRRRGKKDPEKIQTPTADIIYHCLRCSRETAQDLQPTARRNLKKAKRVTLELRPSKEEDDAKPKTANASSKQRQKARKGGLQAMLEKKKSQTPKMGLDLMDFAM